MSTILSLVVLHTFAKMDMYHYNEQQICIKPKNLFETKVDYISFPFCPPSLFMVFSLINKKALQLDEWVLFD